MTDESPASGPASIGRYQVIRTLGEGGMGAVFLATDPAIDRQVALKLMRAGFNSGSLRERFAREARAVGRLHHPNIVTIFEFGEHQGEPFIAMEYVEGETLSSLIGRPDVTPSQIVGLMDGLCAGLHYAHRAGIIHRDIKPVNVMVDTEGIVKILDFGIARAAALSLTQSGTQPGTVLGTLNYMSPEQLSGKAIDQRTDIFAVGAVFYELLAGRQAFPGDIDSGILQLILLTGPAPLAELRPDLDPTLVAIVNRCLERDVERRYPDLGVMRKDLAAFQRSDAAPRSAGATVIMTPGGSPSAIMPADIRTPGPDTRAAVERAKWAELDAQVTDARAALEREEYTRATEACQQVLSVEPSHSGALALQAQLNSVLQARAWLADGQTEFNRGAMTSATALVDRALAVRPAMPEALRLRAAIEEARIRALQASASAPTMLVTPGGTSGTPAVDAGASADHPPTGSAGLRACQGFDVAGDRVDTGEGAGRGGGRACSAASGRAKSYALDRHRRGRRGGRLASARSSRLRLLVHEAPPPGQPRLDRRLLQPRLLRARAPQNFRPRRRPRRTPPHGRRPSTTPPPRPRRARRGQAATGSTPPAPRPVRPRRNLRGHRRPPSVVDEARGRSAAPRPPPPPADARPAPVTGDAGSAVPPDSTTPLSSAPSAGGRGMMALPNATRGCNAGNARACRDAGLDYRNGRGAARDDETAAKFYQRACDGGDPPGCVDLGQMYATGSGVAHDESRAAAFYQKACDANAPVGCGLLGVMYQVGRAVPRDEARALSLYVKGCDGNNLAACNDGAMLLENARKEVPR